MPQNKPVVVYLVDDKKRDLYKVGLIANRLENLGITCHLETLEAYKAVLGRYQPDMIIFNHLLASHLVAYSQRLSELGVLVAVMPNEGIIYKQEALEFNAGRYHNDAVIDLFLCWNQPHRDALLKSEIGTDTRIEVVGVPRFDYYFEPWSKLYSHPSQKADSQKPKILVCTNFTFSRYANLPKREADNLFKDWSRRLKAYEDYWGAVQVHKRNRERLFDFLIPLIDSNRFDIILKPHPQEEIGYYQQRVSQLSSEQRSHFQLEHERNITDLILQCDLEISMDSCTTALESWIAGKPTIELVMERHVLLSNPILDGLNLECSDPNALLELVNQQLLEPTQPAFQEKRKAHLARWCDSQDGHSSERVARAVQEVLEKKGRPNREFNQGLTFSERKKALKLRILSAFDQPYGWKPLLSLRSLFQRDHVIVLRRILNKAIKPSDAQSIKQKLKNLR